MIKPTRGERNNNPGNIRKSSIIWQGIADGQNDPSFIVFKSPQMGIRALVKTLLTYYHKHLLRTVEQIIDRWAPAIENDTNAYINAVCGDLRVSPADVINLDTPETMLVIVRAIIKHENGRCIYADAVLESAVESALIL